MTIYLFFGKCILAARVSAVAVAEVVLLAMMVVLVLTEVDGVDNSLSSSSIRSIRWGSCCFISQSDCISTVLWATLQAGTFSILNKFRQNLSTFSSHEPCRSPRSGLPLITQSDKRDKLPESVPHAHKAGVGVHVLC